LISFFYYLRFYKSTFGKSGAKRGSLREGALPPCGAKVLFSFFKREVEQNRFWFLLAFFHEARESEQNFVPFFTPLRIENAHGTVTFR